jgi:DNA-binding IclR family transcriptional regulator
LSASRYTGDSTVARTDISQTLARGLEVLRLLGARPEGMFTSDLAESLAVHRTIVYRLLRTLEAYDLVSSAGNGRDRRHVLGVGITRLAQTLNSDLQSVALPAIEKLVAAAGATAHLAVADGDETVVLFVLEPRHADIHIAYRAGQRHPLDRGSAGLAILAARPATKRERREVKVARERGYAVSLAEIVPGVIGVSAPIKRMNGTSVEASVGVSVLTEPETDRVGPMVVAAAADISRRIA